MLTNAAPRIIVDIGLLIWSTNQRKISKVASAKMNSKTAPKR
ncbi:MAG: hypothetical protein R3A10_06125 [Caldilineaceae bacterium]